MNRFCFLIGGVILVLQVALFSGCAVGPDYKRPEAPKVESYTATQMPQATSGAPVPGGDVQRFALKQDIPSMWWTLFQSKELDELIRQAFTVNPTLESAKASLRQANENMVAAYGAFMPSIDATASVSRQKISGAPQGQPNAYVSPFTFYRPLLNVSYALDIFGGARRELESLQSEVDFQRFQYEGVYLTLASTIVTTVVHEAALRAQIRASKDIIDLQEKQLTIVQDQFNLGAVNLSDVLAQKAQLAETRAQIPQLEKELELTRHRLSMLAGRLPGEGGLPEFDMDMLKLPGDLPVSIPSDLVRQRPDIRASESIMHSACAKVGVATADLYPQITISGNYGSAAEKTGDLFTRNASIWSIGGSLLQPVFRGGELTARRRAAIAAYDAAAANYRETVLLAFQSVADVLRSVETDARTLKARSDSDEAARNSLEITREQFRLGAASYLSMLNAQRQYQLAEINLIQAREARYSDTVALFQSLGGGWWNRQEQGELKVKAGE